MNDIDKIKKELNEYSATEIGYLLLGAFEKTFNNLYKDFKKSEYYKGKDLDEEFTEYILSQNEKE